MSAPKHTAGPWEVDGWGSAISIQPEGGRAADSIARLHNDPKYRDDIREAITANARLIAAAPDLLASLDPDTLEAIADEIQCFEHSARAASLRGIAKRQRAAIAKATGEAAS